jgi:hypothetical protein
MIDRMVDRLIGRRTSNLAGKRGRMSGARRGGGGRKCGDSESRGSRYAIERSAGRAECTRGRRPCRSRVQPKVVDRMTESARSEPDGDIGFTTRLQARWGRVRTVVRPGRKCREGEIDRRAVEADRVRRDRGSALMSVPRDQCRSREITGANSRIERDWEKSGKRDSLGNRARTAESAKASGCAANRTAPNGIGRGEGSR